MSKLDPYARIFGLFLWLGLSACSTPLPAERSSSILYRDLQRLVSIETTKEWTIDRLEIENILSDALLSVCAVPSETRKNLSVWLSDQQNELGGAPEDVYAKNGNDLGEISDLLEVYRIRLLLNRALETADHDCPFWIKPDPGFGGRHLLDDFWFASVAAGGKVIGVGRSGKYDVNFGGAGRALLGKGLGRHWTVLLGAEIGGGASFPKTGDNGPRGNLSIVIDGVVPGIIRYRSGNSYFELEGGYLGQVTEEDFTAIHHGFRAGIAYGIQYSKQLYFLPSASFAVSYDRVFQPDANTAYVSYLKLGFRGVLDLPF